MGIPKARQIRRAGIDGRRLGGVIFVPMSSRDEEVMSLLPAPFLCGRARRSIHALVEMACREV